MQLDYLLKSIVERFKFEYKIVIIYHTSGNHKEGYKKLKKDYAKYNFISFVERREVFFDIANLKVSPSILNLKRVVKYSRLFNKRSDNFKKILETILRNTDCEFIMFNTDDGVFSKDIFVDEEILNLIRYNPSAVSYRLFVGDNLEGFPEYVGKWEKYYLWDYYFNKKITMWSYPFAVDGTIYETKTLLKILQKVFYHNPVTLEANGVDYVMQKKLYGIGLSPLKAELVMTKLNRVSVDSLNPTIHIKPDVLNEYFINGYTLELELPTPLDNANVVPKKVYIYNDKEKLEIYSMDDFGKKVQNNLGIEGAKQQIE